MNENNILNSVFETSSTITLSNFFLCLFASLVMGFIIAFCYTYKSKYTKSFVVTLLILPSVVSMVIMMVNGSLGAGVAVAGAFSLVRFRSVPGTAKEIGVIFLSMGAGLAAGMGYLTYGLIFSVLISLLMMVYSQSSIGNGEKGYRALKITIPEDINYTEVFEDIFLKYTKSHQLILIKTTNMGSLFKLSYDVTLVDESQEKKFIDDLRCKNANLEITCCQKSFEKNEL